MRFASVGAVYLVWLAVGVVVFFFWANASRKKALEAFADKKLLPEITSAFGERERRVKQVLLSLSFFLIALALMRPQWGYRQQEIKRRGLDIYVAVDTSKSMLAQDIKPSRLERSKLALTDFVKHLKGDRIGLIAFSGKAFVQCPLTLDRSGFLLSLQELDTDTIPRGGTSISSAIRKAVEGYPEGPKKYRALILITDGEDHEGDALKAAEAAKKEGIRIFCIGIGTPEGELIPVENGFLKDKSGAVVKSRLGEDTLKKIALATGGTYVRASSREFGLDLIYREKISEMEKRELEGRMAIQRRERFQVPLALAFLLLSIEFMIGNRKKFFSLRRFYSNRTMALVLALLFSLPGACMASDSRSFKEAGLLYEQGKYDEALEKYDKSGMPDPEMIKFNKGAALYKKGDYRKAIDSFTGALATKDRQTEADALYNLGNSKYRQGILKEDSDLVSSEGLLQEALDSFKRSVEIDQRNTDARYNYEFVAKQLTRIQDKLKKSGQSQNKQNDRQQEQGQGQGRKQDKEQEEKEQAGQGEAKEEDNRSAKQGQERIEERQQQANTEGRGAGDQGQEGRQEQQAGQEQQESRGLSEKEAGIMLDQYGQEEAAADHSDKQPRRNESPVLKDW